jgi:hypothetical protein
MTANDNRNPPSAALSCRRWGGPHLIPGEDSAAYDELLARVATAVTPADTIEEILVSDFVDLEWETLRWRRLKAIHMTVVACKRLAKVLESLSVDGAEKLAESCAAKKTRALKRADRILKSAGLNMDTVVAEALCGSKSLDEIKSIEAMIAMAEVRRNTMLREIERHRATLACALRRTVPRLEVAEYQVIDAPEAKSAA